MLWCTSNLHSRQGPSHACFLQSIVTTYSVKCQMDIWTSSKEESWPWISACFRMPSGTSQTQCTPLPPALLAAAAQGTPRPTAICASCVVRAGATSTTTRATWYPRTTWRAWRGHARCVGRRLGGWTYWSDILRLYTGSLYWEVVAQDQDGMIVMDTSNGGTLVFLGY